MNDLENSIVLSKVKSGDSLLEQIKNTYEFSFPEEERREFSLVHQLIDEEQFFSIYALLNKKKYIGFFSTWDFKKFVYIEHFAIEPIARNGGFGAKVMEQFLAENQSVVLEVELPKDDLSRRRIGFYERLGFVLDLHPYFQPPYRKGEAKIEMRLMSYGRIDIKNSFEDVCCTLYENVYGIKKVEL